MKRIIGTYLAYVLLLVFIPLYSMEDELLFSVDDYIRENGQPSIIYTEHIKKETNQTVPHITLDLWSSNITDLQGLKNITGIEKVTHLNLPSNLKRAGSQDLPSSDSLKNLKLGFCDMEYLPAGFFFNSTTLKKLTIQDTSNNRSGIRLRLNPSEFSRENCLKKISLISIFYVSDSLFKQFDVLETLHLVDYKNRTLPNAPCKNLKKFTIEEDHLARLAVSNLFSRNNLKYFTLIGHNNHSFCGLQSNVFDKAPKIRELQIVNTGIEQLPHNLMCKQTNLRALNLGQNYNLLQIPSLATAKSLRYLCLSDCIKLTINEGSFDSLMCLRELYLQNSHISKIPDHLFHPLISLIILDLSHNKIRHLKNITFENNSKLRFLSLEECPLETIDAKVFCALKNLQTISFSGHPEDRRQITHLSAELISGLPTSLKTLSLGNKYLLSFDFRALPRLTNLENLKIRAIKIKGFSFQTLNNLNNLVKLSLLSFTLKGVSEEISQKMVYKELGMLELKRLQETLRKGNLDDYLTLLQFSKEDLEAAKILLKKNQPSIRNGLTCIQQALEKSLKSFLRYYTNEVYVTHSLKELIMLATKHDQEFKELFLPNGRFGLVLDQDADIHSNAFVFSIIENMRYPITCTYIPPSLMARAILEQAERIHSFIVTKVIALS